MSILNYIFSIHELCTQFLFKFQKERYLNETEWSWTFYFKIDYFPFSLYHEQ